MLSTAKINNLLMVLVVDGSGGYDTVPAGTLVCNPVYSGV